MLSGIDALPPRGAFGKGEAGLGPRLTLCPRPVARRELFRRGEGRREESPQPARLTRRARPQSSERFLGPAVTGDVLLSMARATVSLVTVALEASVRPGVCARSGG